MSVVPSRTLPALLDSASEALSAPKQFPSILSRYHLLSFIALATIERSMSRAFLLPSLLLFVGSYGE